MPPTNTSSGPSATVEPTGSEPATTVQVVPGGAVRGTVRPPGSKSLTNRALLCAAFARGTSLLTGALRSEDTEVMIAALRTIGVQVDVADGGRTLTVTGVQPDQLTRSTDPTASSDPTPSSKPASLYIANSGTTVRFLTAALSAAGGHYLLHGVDRMHQRPIGDLVQAIEPVIDGSIEAQSPGSCPPVLIHGSGWRNHRLRVGGSVSSQYLSGLLMAAPIGRTATQIEVIGELVSRPYVEMTAKVMQAFGAEVEPTQEVLPPASKTSGREETGREEPGRRESGPDGSDGEMRDADVSVRLSVGRAGYRAVDYAIEPDASAASYFWAAAAITGGTVTVEGLSRGAMQGDVGFCDVLEKMGCRVDHAGDSITVTGGPLRGLDVDMNAISDTVQTLAVVALFAQGPTRIRGVAHNRFKETDRIGDLARELRRLGAAVQEHEDGLSITPPADSTSNPLHGATLRTYHDHRMAMSLSLAGLRIDDVKIQDPSCTGKTYPEFFADLESLIGRAHRWGNCSSPQKHG